MQFYQLFFNKNKNLTHITYKIYILLQYRYYSYVLFYSIIFFSQILLCMKYFKALRLFEIGLGTKKGAGTRLRLVPMVPENNQYQTGTSTISIENLSVLKRKKHIFSLVLSFKFLIIYLKVHKA